MPSAQEKPVIRIAPNNPVFDLPVIVGIEERLFEAAGLDEGLEPCLRVCPVVTEHLRRIL